MAKMEIRKENHFNFWFHLPQITRNTAIFALQTTLNVTYSQYSPPMSPILNPTSPPPKSIPPSLTSYRRCAKMNWKLIAKFLMEIKFLLFFYLSFLVSDIKSKPYTKPTRTKLPNIQCYNLSNYIYLTTTTTTTKYIIRTSCGNRPRPRLKILELHPHINLF